MRSPRAEQLGLLSAETTRRVWRGAVQRSRARKGPSGVLRPWPAVVLGVDTARRSGWAISVSGKHLGSGELDTLNPPAVRNVVGLALNAAGERELPCVLVLEKPWGGTVAVVSALGAARERWLSVWREYALGHKAKVVLVTPATWRSAVLGRGFGSKPRDQVRDVEQAVAAGIVGLKPGQRLGADEAPAVCIARWAAHAGEVGKLLGKRAQQKVIGGLA